MAHVAWLHTKPDEAHHTRFELLTRRAPDSQHLTMPPTDEAEHVLPWLFEVGPVASSGMGLTPLSFTEIHHWAERTGVEPTPWESLALRHLSAQYVNWAERAKKPDCPAPWPPQEVDRNRVASHVRRAFSVLEKNQHRRKS